MAERTLCSTNIINNNYDNTGTVASKNMCHVNVTVSSVCLSVLFGLLLVLT